MDNTITQKPKITPECGGYVVRWKNMKFGFGPFFSLDQMKKMWDLMKKDVELRQRING